MSEAKKCSPECKFFRCAKKALVYHGHTAWCKWTEEECDISNCSYATCIKRRLLPGGICGETLKRKTTEIEPEEAVGPPVKLRGKVLRRVGEKEVF